MRIIFSMLVLFCVAQGAEAKTATPVKKSTSWNKSAKTVAKKGKRRSIKISRVHLFNAEKFSKLKFSKRKAYFKAVADYLVAKDAGNKTASLMDLLLPSADAKVYLRNAGFMISSDGARGGTSENYDTRQYLNFGGKAFADSCGADKKYPEYVPCYPGLGITSDFKALCVKNTASQTKKCQEASASANGIDNLVSYLAANPDDTTIRGVLGENFAKIQEECKGGGTYCTNLNKTLGSLTDKGVDLATFNEGGAELDGETADLPDPARMASNNSCMAAAKQSMEKITNSKLDQRWNEASFLAGRVCNMHRDWDQVYKNYGLCNQGTSSAENSMTPTPALLEALGAAGPNFSLANRPEVQKDFVRYFGMTTDQFKKVFCNNTPAGFRKAMNDIANGDGLQTDLIADSLAGQFSGALDRVRALGDSFERKYARNAMQKLLEDIGRNKYDQASGQRSQAPDWDKARLARLVSNVGIYMDGGSETVKTALKQARESDVEWVMREMLNYPEFSQGTDRLLKEVNTSIANDVNTDGSGLDETGRRRAERSFKGMMQCMEKAVVEDTNDGNTTDTTWKSSYSMNCAIDPRSSDNTYLMDDGTSAGNSTIIMQDSSTKMCYLFKGWKDADKTLPILENPYNGENFTKNMTLKQMTEGGFNFKKFSCGQGINPEQPEDNGNNGVIAELLGY